MNLKKILMKWEDLSPEIEKLNERAQEVIIAHAQGVIAGGNIRKKAKKKKDAG